MLVFMRVFFLPLALNWSKIPVRCHGKIYSSFWEEIVPKHNNILRDMYMTYKFVQPSKQDRKSNLTQNYFLITIKQQSEDTNYTFFSSPQMFS